MNKVLNIIKYLLFALAVALILYFIKEYRLLKKDEVTSFNFTFIFMLSLL